MGVRMITFSSRGDLSRTTTFLHKVSALDIKAILEHYGQEGVVALRSATPVDSGETAQSWNYEITVGARTSSIVWTNSHVEEGVSIAILLQYGHGTGTGGYVEGRDFINPAVKPIFDQIADNVWKVVTSA